MLKKFFGIFIIMIMITITFFPVSGNQDKKENIEVDMNNNSLIQQTLRNKNILLSWPILDKLLPSDGAADDQFGRSVFINGEYALVGAILDGENGQRSGSVYIFKYTNTTWNQDSIILSSDGTTGDYFGFSVSLFGDYALIGTPLDDDNGEDSGSAYIFKRNGAIWIQEAKLISSDGTEGDHFGWYVSISGDYALIGANGDDYGFGSAYIFKRNGTTWIQEAKLLPLDGAAGYYFGYSVSLDGDYALIGTPEDDDNNNSGSAYVFKRNGTTWVQEAKLLPLDGAVNDYFGYSVSLNGEYALIGAIWDDDKGFSSGSAYVFKHLDTTWIQEVKLLASDGTTADQFGWSVSVNNNYVLIGSPFDDDNGQESGSAYVFKHADNTWNQEAKLLASDGATDDYLGWSVSIDGYYALIGSPFDDDNGLFSGSAYMFIKDEPPTTPIISGPTHFKPNKNKEFTFKATDNDGDQIYYYVDWGDGSNSGWLGPYTSGILFKASHKWNKKDVFTIKCKAKDIYGMESDFGTLNISTPRSKSINSNFLILLENHPGLFSILQILLNRFKQ